MFSADYEGNDAETLNFTYVQPFSVDIPLKVNKFKASIRWREEIFLAKLKLMYFHDGEDYFNLTNTVALELKSEIRKAEKILSAKDEVQADAYSDKLSAKMASYHLRFSIKH